MPKFTYSAIESASGKEKKGVVESATSEQAAAELKAMGLIPTALAPEGGGGTKAAFGAKKDAKKSSSPAASAPTLGAKKKKGSISFGRVINNAGLTVFTRQLATLVNAGMPIMRSLETLARQEKNPLFKEVVESLVESIRSGGNFSDGLLQHPKVFDRLYVNMVRAGEAGGVLGTVLERLARFMEKAEKIKGKVKSAMTYPVIIVFVAVAIVGALMVFVIPQFEKIFSGMLKGQSMPALTLAVLAFSNFIKHHIIITIGICVVGYFAFKAWHKTRTGTRVVDMILLKAPGLGPLFLKSSVSRFTRTLGTLLASGVPILQALLITRDTSGNVHVADALNLVHDRVKEGDNVARPLESTNVFPTMVTSMIEVGEETGALPEMLNRVADTYDEEVDNSVAGLTSIIEPIMIVFMAVVVGTIVIALFLPIIKIIQSLS
ncbi:MAG: type II secretion system F family protein [Opitutaceae bacterium]|jgi:type IV pilus assembly protein PilC